MFLINFLVQKPHIGISNVILNNIGSQTKIYFPATISLPRNDFTATRLLPYYVQVLLPYHDFTTT